MQMSTSFNVQNAITRLISRGTLRITDVSTTKNVHLFVPSVAKDLQRRVIYALTREFTPGKGRSNVINVTKTLMYRVILIGTSAEPMRNKLETTNVRYVGRDMIRLITWRGTSEFTLEKNLLSAPFATSHFHRKFIVGDTKKTFIMYIRFERSRSAWCIFLFT